MDTRRPTALTDLAGRAHPGQEVEGDPGRTKGPADEQLQAGREELRSTARQVSGSVAAATSRAKEAVGTAAEQVQRTAAEYARQAQAQGIDALDQQRNRAAAQVRTAAEAAQRAAERFREGHDVNIANVIQTFGDEVNRLGDYLERQDVNGIWRDAQSFARRRPELFLGGMFVAGLALSRFLKASADRPEPRPSEHPGSRGEYGGADYGADFNYEAYRTETYRRARGGAGYHTETGGAAYGTEGRTVGGPSTGLEPASSQHAQRSTDAGSAARSQDRYDRPGGTSSGSGAPVGDDAASTGPAAAAAATGIAAVSVRAPAVYTMDIPTSGIPADPIVPADEPDAQRLPPEVH